MLEQIYHRFLNNADVVFRIVGELSQERNQGVLSDPSRGRPPSRSDRVAEGDVASVVEKGLIGAAERPPAEILVLLPNRARHDVAKSSAQSADGAPIPCEVGELHEKERSWIALG